MNARALSPVVILFAVALSAPEVAWSLVEDGRRVVALAREGSRPALRHSRRVELAFIADPARSARRCVDDLGALVERLGDPVLMPLDDHSIWVVHALAARRPLRICGPTGDAAAITLDKRAQFRAAAAAGFDVPRTIEVAAAADVGRLGHLPCIVKPALAARVTDDALGRGRAVSFSDAASLARWNFVSDPAEPMLAQPHVPGVGEGLFGLALADGVVAWSGHRRVRMMNPAGSGSSACINVEPDPATRAVAERFLRDIGWRGLFMIELLRGTDGRAWFMELNGRPWGSMALAIRTGLDYPAWAVRALEDPGFRPAEPPPAPPLLCRHVGRELMHLAFVVRGPRAGNLADGWPTPGATLRAMLFPGRRQAVYNWRARDPWVFFADVLATVRPARGKRGGDGAPRASLARRIGRRLSTIVERRRQRAGELPIVQLRQARSVLFLCYGNINRSALAERHLRQLVPEGCRIDSCGLFRESRRPADPQMVAVARANGVDLDHWSSRTLSADLVGGADLIFAMEASHLVRLYEEHPSTRGRAFLLGALNRAEGGPLEISDPFGHARPAYERCLREVVAATKTLATHLAASPEAY